MAKIYEKKYLLYYLSDLSAFFIGVPFSVTSPAVGLIWGEFRSWGGGVSLELSFCKK